MQLSKEDVFETQSIARVRIHVERAISRVKSWHMFDQVITLSLYGSINQIWRLEYLFYANQFPKPKSNLLRWVFRHLCTQGRVNGQYTLIDKYMWEHLQINNLS